MSTPYALVSAVEGCREVSKRELVALSRDLERAAFADPPTVAVASLQDQRFLSARTRQVYRGLADAGARVTLHARGLQSWLAPGVRGVDLDDDDPLVDEWVVVLLSERRPAVLAAADLKHPHVAQADRRFQCAVSYDADLVAACAALLEPYPTAPLRHPTG